MNQVNIQKYGSRLQQTNLCVILDSNYIDIWSRDKTKLNKISREFRALGFIPWNCGQEGEYRILRIF